VLAFPLWFFVMEAGLWLGWGPRAALAGLVALPITGLAAIAWADRRAEVREDVRVFLRVRRLRRGVDRLSEQRERLVGQLDSVNEEWQAAGAAALRAP
jgi:hypothetical protein